MAADILITVTIAYGLYKTRTGWSYTDKVGPQLDRKQAAADICTQMITKLVRCVLLYYSGTGRRHMIYPSRMCFLTQLPPTLLTIFFICEYSECCLTAYRSRSPIMLTLQSHPTLVFPRSIDYRCSDVVVRHRIALFPQLALQIGAHQRHAGQYHHRE